MSGQDSEIDKGGQSVDSSHTVDSVRLRQFLEQLFLKTVLQNRWIPHKPTLKQAEFLLCNAKEALYGGAAGGGKSDALLMGALQYADLPNYNAILFRRTYNDLALPGALMDRTAEWLGGTAAKWDSMKHIWSFPSGATLTFGNLEHEADKYRYQSAEFQYIGFDELTQFTESQYRYLFSRLRRLENTYIPLRMRAASNPGGIGHDWVKQRFIVEGEAYGRIFIPAKLVDNPFLDQPRYIESLKELDPITRKQYLDGDWTARHGGSIFMREWFEIISSHPVQMRAVRFWDKAATKPKDNNDPDWTVGAKVAEKLGVYYILDIRRTRGTPPQIEALIKQTTMTDGYSIKQYMEQEPGSAGVESIDHYAREVLKGYPFYGIKSTGPKEERAAPVSSAAEAGNIKLVSAPWNSVLLDEFEAFPQGSHDDIVDAVSGAFQQLRTPPYWTM